MSDQGHEIHALQASAQRFLTGGGDAAARAARVVQAMEQGQDVGTALASVGIPPAVCAAFTAAAPLAPGRALDLVGPALDRRAALLAQLRSAAVYPGMVALSTLVVAFLFSADVVPAFDVVRSMVVGHAVSTPLAATLAPAILAALLLVAFAFASVADVPLPVFLQARAARERALVLASVEGFVRAGSKLPAAVRGAAGLVLDGDVRAAALAYADGLERGETSPGTLLDPLPGALLSEAVKAGTEPAALVALVSSSERRASSEASKAIARVQATTLLVAGLGLLLLGLAWFRSYGAVFGSNP